jgi:hypothetical protein
VVHTHNSSTWEAEAEESRVWDQPGLCSGILSQKQNNNNNNNNKKTQHQRLSFFYVEVIAGEIWSSYTQGFYTHVTYVEGYQ